MKKIILLTLLLTATISALAKEPTKFPLVESPDLVSECGISRSHFYSIPGPEDINNCKHISRYGFNSKPSNVLSLLEPSTKIDLGNNDIFQFYPHGFIFKDKVKLEINGASIVSPHSSDMLNRFFNGPPKVYHVIKYPNLENPTHYFITTHYAAIVYEKKRNKFCDQYIYGDATKFFIHEKAGLIAANLEYSQDIKDEKIKAFPIDLAQLCK